MSYSGAPAVHGSTHALYDRRKTVMDRLSDEEMSNIQLYDLREPGDRLRGHIVQPMPCMHFEAEAFCKRRAVADARPFRVIGGPTTLGNGMAPGAGVNFDHGGADSDCRLDLLRVGRNEERDPDSRIRKPGHRRRALIPLP